MRFLIGVVVFASTVFAGFGVVMYAQDSVLILATEAHAGKTPTIKLFGHFGLLIVTAFYFWY